MKNLKQAKEWLKRAKSNMARAESGKTSPEVLYEDLCEVFHRMMSEEYHA